MKRLVYAAIKNMHSKVDMNDYRTGYLYLLKHGIGPGTLPKDVTVLKSMDLPHGFTAVWLDSVLTTDELKEFDIPSETQVKDRLKGLGYTVDDQNQVVPIETTASIKASTNVWENYGDANPLEMGRLIKDVGNGRYEMLYIEPVYDTDSERNLLAAWLYFDIDDAVNGWIADYIGDIADTFGTTVEELMADPMYLFEACVGYFSIDNFGPNYVGYPEQLATEEEVAEALASIGITV